jgi:hypothetical protein
MSKPFVIIIERYLAIPFIGFLIGHGILGMENKDVSVQIVDQIISGVVMITLYILSHKTKYDDPGKPQSAPIIAFFKSLFARLYTPKVTPPVEVITSPENPQN